MMQTETVPAPEPLFRLGIVTPLLDVDHYVLELAQALRVLRADGLMFIHLVVGPERIQGSVEHVFETSEFLPESPSVGGVYDALNQGLKYLIRKHAVTHLSWINGDDLLTPGFREVVRAAQLHQNRIVGGRVKWIGDGGQQFGPVASWPNTWGARKLFEVNAPPFTQQGVVFPSQLYLQCGGFDLSYRLLADSILWHRALSQGAGVLFVEAEAAHYRIRAGQLSGQRELANREYLRWRAGLTLTVLHRLGGRVVWILMKMRNVNIYWKRAVSGGRLRAHDAMARGSF